MNWRSVRLTLWVVPVAVLTAPLAEAAAESAGRPSEFILILQIVLLIAIGRGLGEIMQRIGQPSVIGELLAGLLLGPSLFGWVWPSAHAAIFPPVAEQKALIEGVAQFGILLLLLLTGMETDLGQPAAASGGAPGRLAVPGHGAIDFFGEDRRRRRSRDELHAPQRRSDYHRHRDYR